MLRTGSLMAGMALVIGLFGCSVRRPDVALANVHLGSVRLDGGTLDILLDISNPNRWNIDLRELTYAVSVDDVPVGAGETDTRLVVPGGECLTVRLPVDVSWRGLGKAGRELLSGEVEYRVVGRLTVGTPVGPVTRRFDRRSRFSPLEGRRGGGRLCAEGRPS
jgi:LEA14-like dessication related protein